MQNLTIKPGTHNPCAATTHRDALSLRPADLAARTGMDRGFISRVLRGERGITLDKAVELAGAAGITMDELVRVIGAGPKRCRTAA